MMKELIVLSLLSLGQTVDGSSLNMAGDAQTEALADASSDASSDVVAEAKEAPAAEVADGEKKRDYSAIVGKSGQVDVVFLADINGHIADLSCGAEKDDAASTYANVIGALKQERGKALLIGAGNLNGRAPMARFIMNGTDGAKQMASLWGKAGFDYILPGSEDFYVDSETFKSYSAAWADEKLPMAISNMEVAADAPFGKDMAPADGYTVLEQNGLKIAVIGLNANKFMTGSNKDNLKGLTLKDHMATAKELSKNAKDNGIDIVVAVVNIDDETTAPANTVSLASQVEDIDFVLATGYANSKAAFAYRIEMNKDAAPIFSTLADGEGFNKIHVEFKGTEDGWVIDRADSKLIFSKDSSADATLAASFADAQKAYCEQNTKPVGKGVINGEMTAEQFGMLLAQSARHATKSDVMITDKNMVNGDIFPIKGQISDDVLFAGVSSDGAVYTFKMTGAQIMGLCGNGGVNLYGVDCDAGTINGRPANGGDKYHVVTTESLTNGHLGHLAAFADKMKPFEGKKGEPTPTLGSLTKDHLNDPMYNGKANKVVAIDPVKSFPNLARKVRWSFDGLAQLSVTDTSIGSGKAGVTMPEYDVAQLQRSEQTSVRSLLQLRADANTSQHMFTAEGIMKYSMSSIDGDPYVESEDLTTISLLYRYAGFKEMMPSWFIPLPYVQAVLETELTKPEDDVRTYHHLQLTGTLGARWNPWTPLEFKVGVGWQKELLNAEDATTFGIETGYTLNRFDIAKMGPFTLQGESALNIFISDFRDNPTVKGTWTNKIILNIIGPLGLSVSDDFFFYRQKGQATGFANDIVFGLTYTGRLTTQAF